MLDRRGVRIRVGDVAVQATSGRNGQYRIVRVSGFTAYRVRVDQVDYMNLAPGLEFKPDKVVEVQPIDPTTLVVVELPNMPGRLNRGSDETTY